MIKAKRPGTVSDYGDIGFIEAKDSNGVYQNIDHIYDIQGNIVFQQGYLNEYQGADDFGIPAIGKPLLDYTIYGNSVQNGTPTPDNPIEPEFVGDRTENLLEIVPEMKNKDNWELTTWGTYSYFMYYRLPGLVANELRKAGNIAGKVFLRADGSYYNGLVFIITPTEIPTGVGNEFRLLTAGNALNYQKDVSEYENIYLGIGYGWNITSDNKQTLIDALFDNWDIMLVSGTTVPTGYEPYGYKIPISSGGVNLAWTGWAEDCVSRIHKPEWVSIDGDVITIAANASYNAYDTNYIFKTDWKEKTQYTVSFKYRRHVENPAPTLAFKYTDNTYGAFNNYIGDGEWHEMIVTSAPNKTIKYIVTYLMTGNVDVSISSLMVNEGSVPLPYEPYVTPTVKTIYLGQVQTTRRIKKLVLTGEETVALQATNVFFIRFAGQPNSKSSTIGISNQYQSAESIAVLYARDFSYQNDSGYYRIRIHDSRFETPEDFKSYLADQYDAGTPVTIWCVLAEPETDIVNEPLCRIGDYADSVTFEQAGVEIPTLKKPNTTVIDVETEVEPSEVDVTYRGATKPKYDLFLAKNGDSFEAKDGQSLYIGGNV